ncbi:hypothetical protein H2203_001366 [Taxawa tesnikishii (nom. ined.)]|nr:hypothetical protein H2203_001366 [Dothideales sp. JES 119]
MPPGNLPPTPASSTDIRGKDKLVSLAPALSLPPSAYVDATSDRTASSTPSSNGSDSSYRPVSPTSPATSTRKSSAAQSRAKQSDDTFTLPPPPTRSRKIIHMKPKAGPAEEQAGQAVEATPAVTTGKSGRGREGARRASIDYLRYLERCITDLKSSNNSNGKPATSSTRPSTTHSQTQHRPSNSLPSAQLQDDVVEEDSDQEMSDAHDTPSSNTPSTLHPRPSTISLPSIAYLTSTTPIPSPLLTGHSQPTQQQQHQPSFSSQPQHPNYTARHRHYSASSSTTTTTTTGASFSPYLHSTTTSPFFGPALSHSTSATSNLNGDRFALTSPALKPVDGRASRDEAHKDHEAMAALLMLNQDHRRRGEGEGRERERERKRGVSALDLLG